MTVGQIAMAIACGSASGRHSFSGAHDHGVEPVQPGWRQRIERRFSSDWQRVKDSHWRVTGPVAENRQ